MSINYVKPRDEFSTLYRDDYDRPHAVNQDAPHHVYRHIASDGEILYVGCTVNMDERQKAHRSRGWWALVDYISSEEFANKRLALDEEARLLTKYKPQGNRQIPAQKFCGPIKPRKTGRPSTWSDGQLDKLMDKWDDEGSRVQIKGKARSEIKTKARQLGLGPDINPDPVVKIDLGGIKKQKPVKKLNSESCDYLGKLYSNYQ